MATTKERIDVAKFCEVKPTNCTCNYGNCPNSKVNDTKKDKKNKK